MKVFLCKYIQAVQISQLKMVFSFPYTFRLYSYLNHIHIFGYPDSQISGPFTGVRTSSGNQGLTVITILIMKLMIIVILSTSPCRYCRE